MCHHTFYRGHWRKQRRSLEVDDHAARLYRDWVQERDPSARTPDGGAVGREDADRLEKELAPLRTRDLLPGELHPDVEAALERLKKKRARKRTRSAGMGYRM